jgi:hypothetical protein
MEIDLNWRPRDYFFTDAETRILSRITGQWRLEDARKLMAGNREVQDLYEFLTASKHDDAVRRDITGVHPQAMGGEYLPALSPGEVEIARIVLESTTRDIISFRARRGKDRIRYKVVDE